MSAAVWNPPPGPNSRQELAGVAWDAVRAPVHIARPAASQLGDVSGAIIRDTFRNDWFWLIPPGAAAEWDRMETVQTYGPACWIFVPPAERTHGPGHHWLRPPDPDRLITDPRKLREALLAAERDLFAPRAARLGGRW